MANSLLAIQQFGSLILVICKTGKITPLVNKVGKKVKKTASPVFFQKTNEFYNPFFFKSGFIHYCLDFLQEIPKMKNYLQRAKKISMCI